MAVLFNAGDQLPVIPFRDVVGKAANIAPAHIGATGANVGTMAGVIVTVMVATVAHCPAAGVNVYVVVIVLFNAGDQLPVIPSSEVVGNGLITAPAQTAGTGLKVGVTAEPPVVTFRLAVAVQPRVSFTVMV